MWLVAPRKRAVEGLELTNCMVPELECHLSGPDMVFPRFISFCPSLFLSLSRMASVGTFLDGNIQDIENSDSSGGNALMPRPFA
jgi:hypothetical protein